MRTKQLINISLVTFLLTACATKHAEQDGLSISDSDLTTEESQPNEETKSVTVVKENQATDDIVSMEPSASRTEVEIFEEAEADLQSLHTGTNAVATRKPTGTAIKKAKPTPRRKAEALPAAPTISSNGYLADQGVAMPSSVSGRTIAVDEVTILRPDSVSSGEHYTDYGVNPFVRTAEDALSTFSIDVDTASYTIARRKLNEGTLPNYASVRVEEYINYFDYHYDVPTEEPFAIEMEAMAHPFKEDRHILRVGLQGKELDVETRPPLHLTFLVDVSGSMSSRDKLPLAKESMHMLVDTLREDDTVALVTYAGQVSLILSPTYGDSKSTIHTAIDRLGAGGSTAMSSGLDLAYEQAWASFEAGAENRVVVLSDGDANVGNTGWQDMLKQIKSYADRGITMSTIGLGMGNYKDTSMEQLANKGDGNNFYIDSRSQAHRVFVEDFNSSMIGIARDVKLQLAFNADVVESYRLIGYENRDIADKDFRNDRVDAGEIGAGHNVTALYELVLSKEYGSEYLATAHLRYEKPGADSVATERSWTVDMKSISSSRRASDSLKLAFTVGTFAEILRRSPHVSAVSWEELIEFGEKSKRRGEKDDQELVDLMKRAKDLSGRALAASK